MAIRKILHWGAQRSRSNPKQWKAVIYCPQDDKYYLNLAIKGQSKQYHQDIAGHQLSMMRSTSKFKSYLVKKIP